MGEYPRIASLGLDTVELCARIDRCANPKENDMTPSENIYRSDRDEIDGVIDIDAYNEMIEDFHEDAYNDGWDQDDYVDDYEDGYADDYYDDSMDGDFDSAMRDAGFGTDEDYGYYGEDY